MPAVETVSAMGVNEFPNGGPVTVSAMNVNDFQHRGPATVSALGVNDFPSHGETQTQGVKPRSAKIRHGRHLLQHRKRAGGARAL